jgi:hypothetical protein
MVLRANLTRVTPHFLKIELDLRSPLSCTMIGYIFRERRNQPIWAQEENEQITALYPQADRKDVLAALPTRTWNAIMTQAITLGAMRTTRLNMGNSAANQRSAAQRPGRSHLEDQRHNPHEERAASNVVQC